MNYKTILVHIDPDKRCAARTEVAMQMAKQQDAHLIALYAQAPFFLPSYLLEAGPEIVEAHQKAAAEERARTKSRFDNQVKNLAFSHAEWRTATSFPVESLTQQARCADLIIIGQADPSSDSGVSDDFPERVVLTACRPVLILPYTGSFIGVGNNILIAWNDSPEAAKAISGALPLLKAADHVNLMAIPPKHTSKASIPIEDIRLYLARHGVNVEVIAVDHAADIDVGNKLLSRAADLGSDLIVMGGYGHSRFREWILGGATRTMLESMTVPVLMAH